GPASEGVLSGRRAPGGEAGQGIRNRPADRRRPFRRFDRRGGAGGFRNHRRRLRTAQQGSQSHRRGVLPGGAGAGRSAGGPEPVTATRSLIVNADDFGQSEEVNAGVFEATERGVVTSASLMVRWPAAEQAVSYVRENPRLD